METIVIVEPKTMAEYLRQMEDIGEYREEYERVFGYSLGETEPRMPMYEYPGYDFKVTDKLTHLQLDKEVNSSDALKTDESMII